MKLNVKKIEKNKGFTIMELVISMSIFALMSITVLSKFGTFNQGVLLTNLAYDVALTLRNAQSYGLNVRSTDRTTNNFTGAYGVHFDRTQNTKIIFYIDINSSGVYDPIVSGVGDPILQTTTIQRKSTISDLCVDGTCSLNQLDITFKRPDPNAVIKKNNTTTGSFAGAQIVVKSVDGKTKTVLVNSTGQVSVQ